MSIGQMLALDFMRNAFVTGGCIALAAGLVGYFVVLRNEVFTSDALGHVAFTGSLGGLLAGLNLLAGVFGSCIAVALAIGTFGGRGRGRDVAIGTIFAWVLGIGVLFLSLYTSARSGATGSVGITSPRARSRSWWRGRSCSSASILTSPSPGVCPRARSRRCSWSWSRSRWPNRSRPWELC